MFLYTAKCLPVGEKGVLYKVTYYYIYIQKCANH